MKSISTSLVQHLIAAQFPQYAHLPISPVPFGGHDNRTFHLGPDMSIRLPSGAAYAPKVEKEQYWLPKLAPFLPLPIPKPIAMGKPSADYPYQWSIYSWIEGETASVDHISDMTKFATDLASFLKALHKIDTTGGLVAGAHNFYRGGPLRTYDSEIQHALALTQDKSYAKKVTRLWEAALSSTWQGAPIWVHGDVAIGNLLVKDGHLAAIIDFGGMGIGDPACDLVIAWTFLKGQCRAVFQKALPFDEAMWIRARGWALWKAFCHPVEGQEEEAQRVIHEALET